MSQTLYLECYSGISGDMTVAALLDLGADRMVLERALTSLPVQGFTTEISRVSKSGIDACDFHVVLDKVHENHDHDMKYLHGKEHHHEHKNGHTHADNHAHAEEHTHTYEHTHTDIHTHDHDHAHKHFHDHTDKHEHLQEHSHEHRGIKEILTIIDQADITNKAKEIAKRIFDVIAKAEGKAHGISPDQVHFHEVGAIDSIVDIVAVAVCLDNLDITEVIVPVLYEGSGFVRCQHGMIPIPVPAVANIVASHGLRLHKTDIQGEFVTPTGAAIVAAIKTSNHLPDEYLIEKIGIGAGKRNYERPSILRAMIIKEEGSDKLRSNKRSFNKDTIYKLESNIDDCTGEALGFVMEQLLEAGARDVHYIPVFMKKNRPAYQLNVICKEEDIQQLETIIFHETTTIGIRIQKMERSILEREIKKVNITLGEVQVKLCNLDTGKRIYPEYSSVIAICKKHGISYQDAYQQILGECQQLL